MARSNHMLNMNSINRESHEKLYVQLYKILKRNIEAGEWASGSSIPAEREICGMYDVSTATVRTAVAHLVDDGFLVRQQGKGTFVTDWKQAQSKEMNTAAGVTEGMLHEMNNPLAIIGEKTGWLEDLMNEENGAVKHIREYRDIVRKIKLQINRMKEVNHRMTDLPQRIEAIKKERNRGGQD